MGQRCRDRSPGAIPALSGTRGAAVSHPARLSGEPLKQRGDGGVAPVHTAAVPGGLVSEPPDWRRFGSLPVSRHQLWGFTTGTYRVPEPEEISSALAHTGAEQLHLDGARASLSAQAQLDLGALGKGWAGCLAVEYLAAQSGITGGILALGGNVQTYGAKPDGSPWQIGIQDPGGAGTLGLLCLKGTWAVVTSGGYQRYFEADGVRYCHILDPSTGMPAQAGLTSVTVVAEDGLLADGLSTALYIMGLEEAADFWRENQDFEAVFCTTEGEIYATAGLTSSLTSCSFQEIVP